VARRAKKKATKKKAPGAAARARRYQMTIRAVPGAKLKDPGSKGRAHYDKMIRRTVSAYLDRFEPGAPRRNASQWLANFLREGLVRLR
jgi:hypothetical protein